MRRQSGSPLFFWSLPVPPQGVSAPRVPASIARWREFFGGSGRLLCSRRLQAASICIALSLLWAVSFSSQAAAAPAQAPAHSVCSLVRSPSEYNGKDVWIHGRLDFVPPDSGLTLGGPCSRVVDLTWTEQSPFSQSLGRKSLDIAQQELLRDFTRLHRKGDVAVSVRGIFRVGLSGHYVLAVTRITSISISFLEDAGPQGTAAIVVRGPGTGGAADSTRLPYPEPPPVVYADAAVAEQG